MEKYKEKVYFIGAGPGDPELITIKGQRIVKEADVIIYAGSLVPKEVIDCHKEGAEIYNSASMSLDEVIDVTVKAIKANKKVARVHTGDPAIYGAHREQMDMLDEYGIEYEVIPGVSSFLASAAALKKEFTLPTVSQTVICTRIEGRTPVPEKESLESLAKHRASMAIFLSVHMIDKVVETPTPSTPTTPTPVTPATSTTPTTPAKQTPVTPAPKDGESGSSVTSPSTGNHSDESGAPSTTPTGDSTATQPSDSTSSPVTPSEEAPVTSGDTNSTTQPAGESGSSETTSEPSNTPSEEATNDSGSAATSTPTPATSTPEPKSEEELKKEETLKSAKKESIDDNIGEVVKIKADAIEKVLSKEKMAQLKELLAELAKIEQALK